MSFDPTIIEAARKDLLHSLRLQPKQEFDTRRNTNGEKQVWLVSREDRSPAILRVGEQRPKGFFPGGYQGKHLRIPKIFIYGSSPVPYELEEYVAGQLMFDRDRDLEAVGQWSSVTQEMFIRAFWEFQNVGAEVPMEVKNVQKKIDKHLTKARILMKDFEGVNAIVAQYADFWSDQYPSKWKFAADNLILDAEGRVTFIDNTGVAKRHFGYDFGWTIWPRWVRMSIEALDDVPAHLRYLAEYRQRIVNLKLTNVEILEPKFFWLMVLERTIGAFYDIANETPHLNQWQSMPGDPAKRREAHVKFLNALQLEVLTRLI